MGKLDLTCTAPHRRAARELLAHDFGSFRQLDVEVVQARDGGDHNVGLALTPGGCHVGYMVHTGCRQSVPLPTAATGVVTPGVSDWLHGPHWSSLDAKT
jgi:hypothetical protein